VSFGVRFFDAILLSVSVEATDKKGDSIHQSLTPKKMAKLDESKNFRPFKFRIQAFTNAFNEAVGGAPT
jgi:hypothetical protein